MPESGALQIYVAKGARVFVFGMLSILIPLYLNALGYSSFFFGLTLVVILAGNVFSNLVLTYFEWKIGKRRLLLAFSLLMVGSGLLLAFAANPALILVACFIGNISTTGTEAGPFQSVEAGILPELARSVDPVNAFGKYNMVGYAASAAGALAVGVQGILPGGLTVYRALFVVYGLVGVLLLVLYATLGGLASGKAEAMRPGLGSLSSTARRDVISLSGLFSIDAFGGSFVSQTVLSYWFLASYGVQSTGLSAIFFTTNVIVAFSVYAAALVAKRFGNLRTMVYTHLASNAFLVGIPLAGSLAGSLAFLILRQSVSQMDVPTRQALMAEMFGRDERVAAYAVTNTARSVAAFAGGPVNAALLALNLLSGLIFAGGFSKIAYDVSIYGVYRKRFR